MSGNQTKIHLDFEFKSGVDLKEAGLENFLSHPDAAPLLCAWAKNEAAPSLWDCTREEMPAELQALIENPEVLIFAWNCSFERAVLLFLGFPESLIPFSRFRDPMVIARMLSMPGKLEKAGPILGLKKEFLKDERGEALIDLFCTPFRYGGEETLFGIRPNEYHSREDRPEEWKVFGEYCCQDLIAEREILRAMKAFPLPDIEQRGWELDQRINLRGIPVDKDLVLGALEIALQDKELQLDKIKKISGVENPNSPKQILTYIKKNGYTFNGMAKTLVARALAGECDLTDACREVLETRKAASKTSYTKFQTILDQVGLDGRLRHQFAYMGAARTGRWASYGVQLTNLPRPTKAVERQMDLAVELLRAKDTAEINLVFDDPMAVATSCVRAAFKAPPGKKLVVCDLNAIENRVLGWMTGCDAILEVFREGRCPYLSFAAIMYKVSYESLVIIDEQGNHKPRNAEAALMRQLAKPAVLGCGYRLSGGDFDEDKDGNKIRTGLFGYAANMSIEMSKEEAHLAVAVFREAYPQVVQTWYDLEDAAFAALRGGAHKVGPLTFQAFGREPDGNRKLLRMLLPSGRGLYYIRPRVEEKEFYGRMKKTLSYEGLDQQTKQWGRVYTNGGKILENGDQAISRDILLHGMLLADSMGAEIVLHCHDEIAALEDENNDGLEILKKCMTTAPSWAESLPLGAEGFTSDYYRKG